MGVLLCSVFGYSYFQCPGVMPGFTGDGVCAHLAACASTDEISPGYNMEHGTCKFSLSILTTIFQVNLGKWIPDCPFWSLL